MTTPSSAPTIIAPSPAALAPDGHTRTYEVRTFGCQMNVHDSERLSGSLESAGYVRAEAGERGRRRRHQHLCGPRQRRRQAVRHARAPEVPQRQARRHADRRRRLPCPDGQADGPRQGALGGCRLRHAQHGLPAEHCSSAPVTTGKRSSRSSSRSRSSRRTLPTKRDSRLQRLGVDLGRLQQHLHLLHRAEPPRQREGSPARRHPERDPACSSTTAPSRSRCSARTSTPTASSSAIGRPSASCCGLPARSTAWSASASRARIRPPSPTT